MDFCYESHGLRLPFVSPAWWKQISYKDIRGFPFFFLFLFWLECLDALYSGSALSPSYSLARCLEYTKYGNRADCFPYHYCSLRLWPWLLGWVGLDYQI